MSKTSIEWTDHSINPLRARLKSDPSCVGHYCEKVSSECAHCYSSRFQPRFGLPEFGGKSGRALDLVEPFLDVSKLHEVLRRRKPTKYFWCDMTDLFGHWVSDEWIDQCFAVMALTPWHTHQVLTKRPDRAAKWFAERWQSPKFPPVDESAPRELDEDRHDRVLRATSSLLHNDIGDEDRFWVDGTSVAYANPKWPLPNVWLGTSVGNQDAADERIPHLLKCPAAVRFLSCEPLIGPVDLRHVHYDRLVEIDSLTGDHGINRPLSGRSPNRIHWVIVGGESGNTSGIRPMNPDWARSLRDQCIAAGVPFFFKQWGEYAYAGRPSDADEVVQLAAKTDRWVNTEGGTTHTNWNTVAMNRVGKKAAGRMLDGREWSEFPTTEAQEAHS